MVKSNGEWASRRLLIGILVAGNLTALSGRAAGAGTSNMECGQGKPAGVGEAWLINTRRVSPSCPAGINPEEFSYQVSRDACLRWQHADCAAFFGSVDDRIPVIVFVHGNRSDSCDAVAEAWPVYRQLLEQAGGRPFRFVIWSWPAEKVRGGPRKDALIKADRSDTQSFFLSAWLDRLRPDTPVAMIGYSFGARVICGAIHLTEGGSLQGMAREATESGAKRRPFRVMLVGAALDSEWLLPGSRNGQAAQGIEKMLVTRNCCDRVLQLYPRMRRYDSSSAMGLAGPASPARLAATGLDFEVVPVESQVGREHSWYLYLRSSGVRSRLGWYTFLADGAAAKN
ncbi:MAG: hypothetical protein ACYC6Y_02960 [Thermoguttaceae bacterium]